MHGWLRALAAGACVAALVTAAAGAQPPRTRALWAWDSLPLLRDEARRAEFLRFCAARGIGTVWLQAAALDDARWRTLLRDAHAGGLRVHALDGEPSAALRPNHDASLALIRAVVRYNAGAPADSRFDGVHLDHEPYLLPGWHDPAARDAILEQYLELLGKARDLAHGAGLPLGVDIPFWWPVTRQVLALADEVAVMAYRNTARGPDSMQALASDILRAADGTRARVFVGVETTLSPPEEMWLLTGVTRAAFSRALRAADGLAGRRAGFSIVDAGPRLAAGVRVADPEALVDADARAALLALARQVGAPPLGAEEQAAVLSAADRLRREGEWRGLRAVPVVNDDGVAYGALRATRIMPPKLTFAGVPNERMDAELKAADAAFGAHASYAGLAIHDYDGYRRRFE